HGIVPVAIDAPTIVLEEAVAAFGGEGSTQVLDHVDVAVSGNVLAARADQRICQVVRRPLDQDRVASCCPRAIDVGAQDGSVAHGDRNAALNAGRVSALRKSFRGVDHHAPPYAFVAVAVLRRPTQQLYGMPCARRAMRDEPGRDLWPGAES